MRNFIPFYSAKTKDNFAHIPQGMEHLKFRQEGSSEPALSWYLKMGEAIDLNALVHDPYLIEQGIIPADDVIRPESLSLRGFLFMQKVKGKRIYFQAPLPEPQVAGRSTEASDEAQYKYGMNFTSSIGDVNNPDGYYQISLVYDTRTGIINSGSKVELANKKIEGELSIIGYLLFGKIAPAEVSSTAEE
jgi:hypothetical protein